MEEINSVSDSDDCIKEKQIFEVYDYPLRERIISHLAENSEVIMKSQQRYEPDLTVYEKKEIANELLEKSPSQFLYRFGKHLEREHLQYFNSIPNDPDVKFYLQETQKLLNDSTKRMKIRNRRYGAIKKMESGGSSYFTESEMRKRDPLLFEELVSSNLTEEEKTSWAQANAPPPSRTFSDLLFEQIERNRVTERLKQQENLDDDCFEEDEEDEEEEYEEPLPYDNGLKEILEKEFRSSMCSQFVCGRDGDFDYSQIDESEENDLLEWQSRDEEERYFEEESPRTFSPMLEGECDESGGPPL